MWTGKLTPSEVNLIALKLNVRSWSRVPKDQREEHTHTNTHTHSSFSPQCKACALYFFNRPTAASGIAFLGVHETTLKWLIAFTISLDIAKALRIRTTSSRGSQKARQVEGQATGGIIRKDYFESCSIVRTVRRVRRQAGAAGFLTHFVWSLRLWKVTLDEEKKTVNNNGRTTILHPGGIYVRRDIRWSRLMRLVFLCRTTDYERRVGWGKMCCLEQIVSKCD